MIARELLSNELSALRTSDTGEEAITIMNIFHVKHLPIVNDVQFLGLISEEDILSHDMDEPIGSYHLSLANPFAYDREHIFEVMAKMSTNRLTVIPVVNDQEDYLGLITLNDILLYYTKSYSFEEPGSIIILNTTKPQYSLAEISRIVEAENASILATFLTSNEASTEIHVTLKINKQDISTIIAALQRFDYEIYASFSEGEFVDDLKDRYDALMSYLNV